MVVFRKFGKVVNTVVGGTAKGGVKIVSKAVSKKNASLGDYLNDVGNSVIDASKGAVDSVSQFADGTVRGTYGLVKKNDDHKNQGWNDMKDSTSRTVRGLGSGIKYTVKSTGITIEGLKNNNREQILLGMKNLGKVVATTTFAVGIIDIVDGSDHLQAEGIETRNDHLSGLEHPETGVPFEQKAVELPMVIYIMGLFLYSNHSLVLY